jgi:hypothetical protein
MIKMSISKQDTSSRPIREIQTHNLKYPKRKKNSSLVHTIETTITNPPPDNFHRYKVSFDPTEYAMTFAAYADCDRMDGTKKTDLLDSCRRYAWFVRHKETGKVRVVSNACRLRWCPLCSRAHQNLIEHNVKDWLQEAKQPKFLTLTLKHTTAPLAHQVDNLYRFFLRFRRLKEIRKALHGGVWFFQIKQSESDFLWHPHLHCIIDSDYIPHSLLSKLWLRTTLSSSIVDIRTVNDPDDVAEYVARYCARPSNLKHLGQFDAYELISSMHGRRLCGTWGNAKSIQLTMKSEPDKLAWTKIGDWSLVINFLKTDENAQKIFNAWRTNSPLEANVSMREVNNFLDDYEDFMTTQQKIPEKERTFWSEPAEVKSKALEYYYA